MFISARIITALAASIFLLSGASYLVWSIYRDKASPALGSRIIFLGVDLISFFTFIAGGNRDFIGAVVLVVSIVSTTAVSLSIIRYQGFSVALQRFERYYLIGACAILAVWFLTNNPFIAFLLTQVLVIIGYIPVIQKMFVFKRNTESSPAWTLFLLSYLFGSYPAYIAWAQHHETIPLIYVLRGVACIGAVVGAGLYFDLRRKA